jgi:phenylacetate-CoA ligase
LKKPGVPLAGRRAKRLRIGCGQKVGSGEEMMDYLERRYWDPRIELLSTAELRILQERKMRQAIKQAYHHSPLYRERFDEAGIRPEHIRTLEDLNKIPLLDKYMLRDITREAAAKNKRPFYKIATVPEEDFVTVHTTSGTTGVPYTEPFTEVDLSARGFVASGETSARGYWAVGLRPGDVLAHLWNLGGAMVGGGNHVMSKGAAIPAMFVTIIPGHVGRSEEILLLMKNVKATAMISTPSYSKYLGELALKMGMKMKKDLNLKIVVTAGEPGPASVTGLREELERLWGARVYDMYGAPGVMLAHECEARLGFHIAADYVYVQIVNPETKEELPPGEMGSIVATKIGLNAMPFIRFDTEDRGALITEKCPCGRTHPRISSVPGRLDDMVKIKGFRFYPDTVEKVIKETKGCTGEFTIFLEKDEKNRDKVRIQVECEEGITNPAEFHKKLSHDIITMITLKADVEIVPKGRIGRYVMKAQKVVDLRSEEAKKKYEEASKLRSAKYFD